MYEVVFLVLSKLLLKTKALLATVSCGPSFSFHILVASHFIHFYTFALFPSYFSLPFKRVLRLLTRSHFWNTTWYFSLGLTSHWRMHLSCFVCFCHFPWLNFPPICLFLSSFQPPWLTKLSNEWCCHTFTTHHLAICLDRQIDISNLHYRQR